MEQYSRILDTNPMKYIISGIAVILVFFGGLAIWSIFFPFQGAIIAPGMVSVMGEKKVVQHLEGGIIDKIHIKEGDKVREGDVLIEMKSMVVSSNVDLMQGHLRAKEAEAARLKAEAGLKAEVEWPEEFKALRNNKDISGFMMEETEIFKSRRADMIGKVELYRSQIKQLGNRIDGAKEELKSQEEIIRNIEEDLASKRPLVKEKYLGKTNILELERSLADHQGRKGRLAQDIAQFYQMIEESKLRIVDIENTYKEQAVTKLGEITDIIFEMTQKIKPQLDAKKRLEIVAPISGTVINVRVNSEGSGVIQPGMPMLEIVPEETKMVIKAHVQPKDIISVEKDQETKIQLSAFQRKSTPPIKGRVVYVSPDLISQQSSQGPMSFYEAHIEADETDLKAKNAYLSPGMPAVCYITTDKRTVISYLLDPLLENVDKALRE